MIQSKKNSLKHPHGLMGLETKRGWNGNPERFDNQWTKEA